MGAAGTGIAGVMGTSLANSVAEHMQAAQLEREEALVDIGILHQTDEELQTQNIHHTISNISATTTTHNNNNNTSTKQNGSGQQMSVTERRARFVRTVKAITRIVDARLYRLTASSVETYFKLRWRMRRAQSYRFVMCGSVLKALEPMPSSRDADADADGAGDCERDGESEGGADADAEVAFLPHRERLCRTLKKLASQAPLAAAAGTSTSTPGPPGPPGPPTPAASRKNSGAESLLFSGSGGTATSKTCSAATSSADSTALAMRALWQATLQVSAFRNGEEVTSGTLSVTADFLPAPWHEHVPLSSDSVARISDAIDKTKVRSKSASQQNSVVTSTAGGVSSVGGNPAKRRSGGIMRSTQQPSAIQISSKTLDVTSDSLVTPLFATTESPITTTDADVDEIEILSSSCPAILSGLESLQFMPAPNDDVAAVFAAYSAVAAETGCLFTDKAFSLPSYHSVPSQDEIMAAYFHRSRSSSGESLTLPSMSTSSLDSNALDYNHLANDIAENKQASSLETFEKIIPRIPEPRSADLSRLVRNKYFRADQSSFAAPSQRMLIGDELELQQPQAQQQQHQLQSFDQLQPPYGASSEPISFSHESVGLSHHMHFCMDWMGQASENMSSEKIPVVDFGFEFSNNQPQRHYVSGSNMHKPRSYSDASLSSFDFSHDCHQIHSEAAIPFDFVVSSNYNNNLHHLHPNQLEFHSSSLNSADMFSNAQQFQFDEFDPSFVEPSPLSATDCMMQLDKNSGSNSGLQQYSQDHYQQQSYHHQQQDFQHNNHEENMQNLQQNQHQQKNFLKQNVQEEQHDYNYSYKYNQKQDEDDKSVIQKEEYYSYYDNGQQSQQQQQSHQQQQQQQQQQQPPLQQQQPQQQQHRCYSSSSNSNNSNNTHPQQQFEAFNINMCAETVESGGDWVSLMAGFHAV
ncbi:hypothetical protein HK100_003037 [Physocladia obscura]|uniref:Uncharacterized protein n=1 Tax=Physocladia obscura TaxID=109957 RepID=A0AAD5T7X8_9FUNG|nr:hypothetical protein HK100_003037 [Physocladia obscura]